MDAIDVLGPMASAFQNGGGTYRPVFQGTKLEDECRQTAATLRNLKEIIAAGNPEIAAFLLGMGHVLVVFPNGCQYLATGFGYGDRSEKVKQFAYFAAKHGFGDEEELFARLSTMRPDASDFLSRVIAEDELAEDCDSILSAGPHII